MKTRTYVYSIAAVLAGMLTISASALAARPPDAGNGGGGGGGGGTEPPDFGDLIILYRDAYGVPHLTGDGCQQPLPSDTCDLAVCTVIDGAPSGVDVLPVDPATCAVTAACAACTEEVDFGRINVARAPAEVFEQQLDDVLVNLATADCITLDPAGRLVANRVVDNPDPTPDEVLTSTIDSPLQNLAIYRQLMLTGSLGITLPASTFDTAARGLGVASDKTGDVNVDLVAYLNHIMGLSDPATTTVLGKICIDVKEEVKGVVQPVQKCFLNYGPEDVDHPPVGADYQYVRDDNFSTTGQSLPFPAYIPDATSFGEFEYLVDLLTIPPTFGIMKGPILDAVFCVDTITGDPVAPDNATGLCVAGVIDTGFLLGNIGGFAQAADDTRAVINYMHNWQVPVDYVTPVPCSPSGGIFYDLSISEESGLQVPKNYVNDTEREFFVTVANAGPDPANGTLTVTADSGVNGTWIFTFSDGDGTEIAAGASRTWTQLFTIDTSSDTISWNATVVADPPGTDPLLTNNSRDATSSVRNTGGGGGGQGGKP